ncbi:DNA polymerase ligase N-terminal domain-containing protein [uncultured Bacteroides sp.]|uniref:DNA polymerase ligase N-terminal domain-containing protein n=1 Tax=uncultured Bacteroides sp. TaxID=162156 RepID=UPI0025F6C40A|nr:DNA polymerase ligase N-terminal domain-containing protein [uncultured Bacteroides sp.]
MSLKEYQKKRHFNSTPEPEGDLSGSPNRIPVFVIQKHETEHFHFDFRLEVNGVLKSWLLPKGPSMNPKDKRLAIQMEDYPLSYAHFEGVIPEGNYGAGTIEIWDNGTYAYIDKSIDIAEAIEKGMFEFKLHGHKLKGLFTIVRTNMDGNDNNWLLMKKDDVFAVAHVYDAKEIPAYDGVFL